MNVNFKYIDLSYLDLMSDGDLEMKQMMLDMLIEEIPAEINKMLALHKEEKLERITRSKP